MADKNFKVKKNIQVTDLAVAGPVTVDSSGVLASSSALPVNLGGTGQTSASAAFDALVPTQTNNANKLLGTDGTSVSWVSPGIAYQTSAPDNPVTGQLWVDSDETGDSLDPYIIRRKTITATAGQTVFTTDVVFTDGYEQIYYNGVLLVRTTDYTTNGGTNTVTLLQGASAGDTVEIISSTPINLVNTLAANSANTIIAQTASSIPLTVQGAASQTANLLEVKNSAGEIRHEFRPSGVHISRGYAEDQSAIAVERYGAGDAPAVLALRSYGGTITSPTIANQDTRVGLIAAEAWDGTALRSSSRITFTVDGPVIAGNIPGRITFNTVPVGGGAGHIERMRINSAGNVGIGVSNNDYNTYGGRLTIGNAGQASMFMWNFGQGSGHIGFPASGSTMRIVNTFADGLIANGKGIDINANGNVGVGWNPDNNWHLSVNSGASVGAGAFLSTASTNIIGGLFENSNASFTNNLVKAQMFRSNNAGFIYYSAISNVTVAGDTDWYVRGDGQVYSDGSTSMSTPADYAEYFEWADGNINNEDRAGYSVSLINGNQIKIAESGEDVIGIVSANPAVVGDAAWNMWIGKYKKDQFNRYVRDENGDRILSEDFDPESEYVSREDRPEWSPVGLVGKLRMHKGQITDSRWIKIRDISDEIEEWLLR